VHTLSHLSPVEAFVYQAVVLLWLASEVGIATRVAATRSVHGRPRGLSQDRWSGPALVIGVFVSIWTGLGFASGVRQAAISPGGTVVFVVGALLAVAGVAIRLYAVVSLGRWFELRVTTSAGHPVIESGPYRLVRHPSYAGGLLTVLGVELMAMNWLALVCFVLAWPGFAYRIKVEESALVSSIGDPYREYMKRTKRLVPFVL
jgi:protein-S-isoprenylcysteine O-methyltransferase Ste14